MEQTTAPGSNKLLLGLLGGVAAVLVGTKLFNLSALQKELQIDQKISLDPSTGTSLTEAKLRVDLTLKNPTNGTLTVKQPVVTLFFNNSEIGTTDTIKDTDYLVPKFGQVQLPPIIITVSMLSAGLAAFDFFKNLKTTRQAMVKIRSLTMINGQIPYERVDLKPLFK